MDYYEFFKKLNEKNVKYITVGGLAVNLHGIPRLTYDIDLIVEMSDENIQVLMKLLNEMGYKPKIPVNILDFANMQKRKEWIENKNMKAFCLVSDKLAIREVDIVVNTRVNYDSAKKNVVFYDLYDTKIATVGIDDLIRMKKNTGRKQDETDIEHLRRIKK